MSEKTVDLSVVRGEQKKKKKCEFCNGPAHDFWLGCARISGLTVYEPETQHPMDIHFHPSFFGGKAGVEIPDDDGPDDAA